ncbi:MAG TPA: hypothetical protein DHV08_10390 [Rhodocyclaceae bacterium]|nr:hypothetical protein [Rhodocyclaceae bacterium]
MNQVRGCAKSLELARRVLRIEAEAVSALIARVDERFLAAVDCVLGCRGRVIVSGIGKSGHIARKLAATLASTGTPAYFVHAAEANHGDLGMIQREDVLIALSYSGETQELLTVVPMIKRRGGRLIALTGNPESSLARLADVHLDARVAEEACPLNLAPTASTTAALALGDALAVALLARKGFREKDFAFFHPGGILGKRLLLKVGDIMRTGNANSVVSADAPIKKVLLAITRARAGSASVVDSRGRLIGIFTEGDLRRHLETDPDALMRKKVKDLMTKHPTVINKDALAAEALHILQSKKIDELPVVDPRRRPIGLLDVQDILKAGLV